MTSETIWLLVREGFNANEVAAAAHVSPEVALLLIEEAKPVAWYGYQ